MPHLLLICEARAAPQVRGTEQQPRLSEDTPTSRYGVGLLDRLYLPSPLSLVLLWAGLGGVVRERERGLALIP